MKDRKELKHKVLEVLEGGLRGNLAARIFSWLLIILIVLSMLFMLLEKLDVWQQWHETFEIIETITIGVFTLELILGFWTADIRFARDPHPRIRYMTNFMTNIQFLAILPFYLGLLLNETPLEELSEYFQILKLLHLLKIGELAVHAHKEKKAGEEEEDSAEEKGDSE